MKNRGYMTADLCRAFMRAADRGPEAVERFKAALNQASFQVLNLVVSVEVAFFELLGEELDGRPN